MLLVYCKPGEENCRHRSSASLALERASGGVFGRHLGRGERVVANDRLAIVQRRHEYAGGVRRLRTERMPLQPVVERRLATVEVLEPMLLPERLRPPVCHALRRREDARLGEE